MTDLVLVHVPTGKRRVVSWIEMVQGGHGLHNVIIHMDDGDHEPMSLVGYTKLVMGGTILHDSVKMILE